MKQIVLEFAEKIQSREIFEKIQQEVMILSTFFLMKINNTDGETCFISFEKIMKMKKFLNFERMNHFCLQMLKDSNQEIYFGRFYLFKLLDVFSENFSEETSHQLEEILQLENLKSIEREYLLKIKFKIVIKNSQ
jgi:hypothetical protein